MRDRNWAGFAASATCAAFLPTAAGGIVFDDHRFLADNVALTRPSILWRAFTDPACQSDTGAEPGLWRPLRTLSFALDRAVFGAGAAGPHVVNAALHGATTGLVFLLLRRLGAGAAAAFAGALLFGLHPAQAECVSWLSSRGDVMALMFVLAAILLDLGGRTGLALVAGAAGLLSKEQAVVWPALACVASLMAGRDARTAVRRAALPAAAAAVFLVARQLVLPDATQGIALGHGRAGFAQIAAMLGHQTWYTLVPVGTLFDWQMPWGVCPWPVAAAGLVVAAAAAWSPTRLPALWFLAALVPTLFVQAAVPLNIMVCDRWLYFALVGFALVAARAADRVGIAPALVAASCFGVLAEREIPVWRSDETLWTRTIDAVPGHWRASHWLGMAALRRGDFEEAVRRLRTTEGVLGHFHLACALDALGRTKRDPGLVLEARDVYLRADREYQAEPRAYGRAWIQPLAHVGAVGAALLVGVLGGDSQIGAREVSELVASPPPPVPEAARQNWQLRIDEIARFSEQHPLLGPDVARRVREWGRLP